jgi:hypothetical protein
MVVRQFNHAFFSHADDVTRSHRSNWIRQTAGVMTDRKNRVETDSSLFAAIDLLFVRQLTQYFTSVDTSAFFLLVVLRVVL